MAKNGLILVPLFVAAAAGILFPEHVTFIGDAKRDGSPGASINVASLIAVIVMAYYAVTNFLDKRELRASLNQMQLTSGGQSTRIGGLQKELDEAKKAAKKADDSHKSEIRKLRKILIATAFEMTRIESWSGYKPPWWLMSVNSGLNKNLYQDLDDEERKQEFIDDLIKRAREGNLSLEMLAELPVAARIARRMHDYERQRKLSLRGALMDVILNLPVLEDTGDLTLPEWLVYANRQEIKDRYQNGDPADRHEVMNDLRSYPEEGYEIAAPFTAALRLQMLRQKDESLETTAAREETQRKLRIELEEVKSNYEDLEKAHIDLAKQTGKIRDQRNKFEQKLIAADRCNQRASKLLLDQVKTDLVWAKQLWSEKPANQTMRDLRRVLTLCAIDGTAAVAASRCIEGKVAWQQIRAVLQEGENRWFTDGVATQKDAIRAVHPRSAVIEQLIHSCCEQEFDRRQA